MFCKTKTRKIAIFFFFFFEYSDEDYDVRLKDIAEPEVIDEKIMQELSDLPMRDTPLKNSFVHLFLFAGK